VPRQRPGGGANLEDEATEMGFLSRLFGGGGGGRGSDTGLYYYVQCDRCGEVIRVRVNPMSELSHSENERGFFVRKYITGKRCYNRIEALFNYDSGRRLKSNDITGGKLVDEAAFRADQLANPATESGGD
jgi:hypothetical protein